MNLAGQKTVNVLHAGRVFFHRAVMVALLGQLIGCNADECERYGEQRCRGNAAELCSYAGDSTQLVLTSVSCGSGACREDGSGAYCALAAGPDSRCGGAVSDGACEQNVLVVCRSGFAINEVDCETAEVRGKEIYGWTVESGGVCVATPHAAFCARDDEPSAACPEVGLNSGCAGNELVSCRHGYVTSSGVDCADRFCSVTPGYAECMAEAALHPLCPPETSRTSVCDGPNVIECVYGHREGQHPCEAGYVCLKKSTEAGCLKDNPDAQQP